MESTTEINDSAEPMNLKMKETESSAEAPNIIRRRDDVQSGTLDGSAVATSPLSPDLLMETLTGKRLDYDPGSAVEPAVVEELTLSNYKGPEMCMGEGSSGKMGLWSNLTRLSGDLMQPDNRNLMMAQFSSRRPTEQSYSKVNDYLAESENRIVLGNANGKALDGIRTKVLSASGFGQFVVRNDLQGKGVSHVLQRKSGKEPNMHRENYREPKMPGLSQNNMVRQGSSFRPTERVDDRTIGVGGKSLVGGGNGQVPEVQSEGISLRQWLRHREHKLNKSERLRLFKQVLELVDSSHSQGFILQNLRPSYLFISPSNVVKYGGSFTAGNRFEHTGSADHSMGYLEHHSKRKRYSEYGNEEPGVFSKKQPKHDQQYNLTRMRGFPVGTGRQQAGPDIQNLEERWYASPEELKEFSCSFSSNIYSLGVLFFELFCCFETSELLTAAMSDLRYRILPPSFLSKSPKEAGFCLWLLHPEPSSRPNSRDILQADLISEDRDFSSLDQSSASIDEEDAEADLLLHFLEVLKEQKDKQAAKLVSDVECLQSDIQEVDRRYSSKTEFLSKSGSIQTNFSYVLDKHPTNVEETSRFSDSNVNQKLMRNVAQLENAYFSLRSKVENVELPETSAVARSDTDVLKIIDNYSQIENHEDIYSKSVDPLGIFFEGLCKYARYSQFEVCGSLRTFDILNSANVICSLSFDRDEDYFATAGVAKKIKIFEFDALLKDNVDIHYPLVEMSSRSKLSCVCWNTYIKNYLASTDYEGVVQLWDASTGQGFNQYKEHRKRAWSVDFSPVDPIKLASGSDDCCVKLWSINERACIDTIRSVANVCCVQFSPHSSNLVTFGSADYKIYCYDLRHTRSPWCTLAGHGKAVSHVKFVDSETVISASTDNTLKLWDLKKTSPSGLSTDACSLTLSGHTNEKNFVGLSVSDGYIACGSETNDVYAYYRTLPMPITSHKFGSTDPNIGHEANDDSGQFVSSVCWRNKSNMVVATNSTGSIEVLRMV